MQANLPGHSRSNPMVVFIRVPSWLGRQSAHPENVMAQLDMGYAISLLMRRGVDARLLDIEALGCSLQEVEQRLERWQPSVLVLHAITPAIPNALKIARLARERIPALEKIYAVGQHATVLPETLLDEGSPVDACIRGEYEVKLADLICGQATDLDGVARRGPDGPEVSETVLQVTDLDALPMPAHYLWMRPEYKVFHPTGVARRWRWGFLMTSRGCPYRCVYCSPTLRNSYGSGMRYRAAASVVEELLYLRALGATVIHFRDDIFTMDRERTLELCELMVARGFDLQWTAQTRADRVDADLLRAMKRAGCATIYFGVESGSPRVLDRIQKGSTVEQAERAFTWARAAGLHTVGFFMLGNPEEEEEDIRLTYDLMLRLRPDIIQVAFFTPYPGSPMFDPALLSNHDLLNFSHYNNPINHSNVSDDDLRRWQKKFYVDFILKSGFIGRYLRRQTVPNLVNFEKVLDFFQLSARALCRRGDA